MAKLTVGIIGAGRMGQIYGDHIARHMQSAEVVAVADPRKEVAEQYAGQIGVTAYADYHDLLAHPNLEAVIICTPTNSHCEIAVTAAKAGKQIFCEKPPALNLREVDGMIAAAEKAGVLLHIGFMRRFDDAYITAKRQIEDGVIGTPVTIRSVGRDPSRPGLKFSNPLESGGLILEMAIHDFDIVHWLMADDVERIYCDTAALVHPELAQVGDADTALMTLRFARGGLGNVEVSRTAVYGYDISCDIVGSQGTLHVGYLRQTAITVMTVAGVTHDVVPHFPERFGAAYARQIEAFIDCVREGKPAPITTTDARAALQIGLAAIRSRREGRVISVREVQS